MLNYTNSAKTNVSEPNGPCLAMLQPLPLPNRNRWLAAYVLGGRPTLPFVECGESGQKKKIAALVKSIESQTAGWGLTTTQIAGRIIQHEEYVSNRPLGVIGGHIFRGEADKITSKSSMPVEEAEYMRSVELAGIGQRVWTNIRLRLLKFGTILPSYRRLVESTRPLKYPMQPFFGGWRANLKDIVKVPNLVSFFSISVFLYVS